MRKIFVIAAAVTLGALSITGQGKILTSDPLTGLPLFPGTDAGIGLGNAPGKLPDTQVCKSKMQGERYDIYKTKVDDAVAWYTSHLSGFKEYAGTLPDSKRVEVAFRNANGTLLVVMTGGVGPNAQASSVAYEKFQPGLSEKTVAAIPTGKPVCED